MMMNDEKVKIEMIKRKKVVIGVLVVRGAFLIYD